MEEGNRGDQFESSVLETDRDGPVDDGNSIKSLIFIFYFLFLGFFKYNLQQTPESNLRFTFEFILLIMGHLRFRF